MRFALIDHSSSIEAETIVTECSNIAQHSIAKKSDIEANAFELGSLILCRP